MKICPDFGMVCDEILEYPPIPFRPGIRVPYGAGVGKEVLETVLGIDVIGFARVGKMFGFGFRRVVGEEQCR